MIKSMKQLLLLFRIVFTLPVGLCFGIAMLISQSQDQPDQELWELFYTAWIVCYLIWCNMTNVFAQIFPNEVPTPSNSDVDSDVDFDCSLPNYNYTMSGKILLIFEVICFLFFIYLISNWEQNNNSNALTIIGIHAVIVITVRSLRKHLVIPLDELQDC